MAVLGFLLSPLGRLVGMGLLGLVLAGGSYVKGRLDGERLDASAALAAQLASVKKQVADRETIIAGDLAAMEHDDKTEVALNARIEELQRYADQNSHACLDGRDVERLRQLWRGGG